MGLLNKAENSERDTNTGDVSLSETAHAAPRKKETTFFSSLDFSAGGAEIFSLSTKVAINAKLKNLFEKNGDEFSRASTTLYDELLGTLEVALARPNIMLRGESGEVKLLIFTSPNFDEKLLQTHIRYTLAPLLGDAVSLLIVTKTGRAESVEEAKKNLEG